MADALIGYTGFIGSNLLTQRKWDATFNRRNSRQMDGRFNTVACCAAPGAKWIANRDPENDYHSINKLASHFGRFKAERFILISTADVFGQPVDADELSPISPDCEYGKHRAVLEFYARLVYPHAQIVRLPGVVGPGMKKGPIYDLQNEHRLEFLNPDSVYQWYDVRNLWRDIEHRTEPIIHLCPKPESLRETVARDFPHIDISRLTGTGTPASYNLRTIYGGKT